MAKTPIPAEERAALSVAEFGAATTLSRGLVMRLIQEGQITAKRAGTRYVIPRSEIDRWLSDDK